MSILDLSLLGLLADQPLHGYELKKRLAGLSDGRASVSFGSLYPALGRLERNGLVEVGTDAPKPRVPMTGSLGAEVAALRDDHAAPTTRTRRPRKVYTLLPAGHRRLLELLVEPPADDRTFAVQLAFARHLTHAERLALLRRRRGELVSRLESTTSTADATRLRDRYRRAARDHGRLGLRSELDWLDRLIDEEATLHTDASTAPAETDPTPDPLPRSEVGGPLP